MVINNNYLYVNINEVAALGSVKSFVYNNSNISCGSL